MRNWFNSIGEGGKKHRGLLLSLLILGGLTTLLLAPEIQKLSLWNLREGEVTVTLRPQEELRIVITDNLTDSEDRVSPAASLSFQELEERVVRSNGFRVVEEEGSFSFQADAPGSSITFLLLQRPESHLSFQPQSEGGIVEVATAQGRTVTIDTGLQEEPIFRYYPFSFGQTKYLLANSILLYLGAFLASLAAWSVILVIFKKVSQGGAGVRYFNGPVLFLVILLGTFLVLCLEYYLHPQGYQVAFPQDAYYYLHPMAEGGDGAFSLRVFIENLYSFRGYFPSALSLVFLYAGNILDIGPMVFHYFFISFLAALVFGLAIPRAYEAWRGRKPSWLQAGGLYILFLFFYGNDLFFTLSDIPSSLGALGGLSFLLWAIRKRKAWAYILAGLLIGLAAAYRASYSLLANIILAGIAIWLLRELWVWGKGLFLLHKDQDRKGLIRAQTALLFPLGLLLILWPQIYINDFKGLGGIYPKDVGYAYDTIQQEQLSLTEFSVHHGLQSYYFAQPLGKDQQMNHITQSSFPGKILSKYDDLHLLVKDPLGFGTILLKKAFWGFNKSPGGTYMGARIPSEGFANLYRSFNYSMIIIGLYLLYRRKDRETLLPDKVRWPVLGLFAITAGPQLLLHIEWRYFMFPHLLFMFLFAYFFLETLEEGGWKRWKPGHVLGLALLVLGANAIHFTMLENFLL